MKCSYLACKSTIRNSKNRQYDAFEHDQTMDCLEQAFHANNSKIEENLWDDDTIDWSAFDAVIIGTCWDYAERKKEFLEALQRIDQKTHLFNSVPLIAWNSSKDYLRDLKDKGIPSIPTLWTSALKEEDLHEAFAQFATDTLACKRTVGASAIGQFLVHRDEKAPPWKQESMLVQPYLESITTEGEYSFIFVDGEFSHCLLKTAKPGDYRIQSVYGGKETPIMPQNLDLEAAKFVMSHLDVTPLYARVDMIRSNAGALLLMELELVEPFLYPLQGENLGPMLYDAIKRRI